jgi:ankyrin repeat protein
LCDVESVRAKLEDSETRSRINEPVGMVMDMPILIHAVNTTANGLVKPNSPEADAQITIVKLLLDAKADIHQRCLIGYTAMHRVTHAKIAQVLYDHGAEIDTAERGSDTPLMQACIHGHVEVVQFLVSRRANIVSTLVGPKRWTHAGFNYCDRNACFDVIIQVITSLSVTAAVGWW